MLNFSHFRALVPAIERGRVALTTTVPRKLETVAEGQRNATLTSLAGTLRRRGLETDEMLPSLLAINEGRCEPPLAEAEVRAIAISVGKYEPSMPLAVAVDLDRYPLNDIGNGRRMADQYRGEILYCAPMKTWLCFDGKRWSAEHGEIERRAKVVALSLKEFAEGVENKELQKAMLQHYKYSTKGTAVREMAIQASTEEDMCVFPERLDSDRMLFNVANGTLDLRTGQLRPHSRDDLITKISAVVYDNSAECPLWLRFLHEIMDGDEELVEYLQRVIGYCLTGDTGERAFFILWGEGANGKSTLIETIRTILGDYGSRASMSTFMAQGRRDQTNDLARLQGKRLVTASESESGQRLSESLVKDLTGNEVIMARFLFKEFFEFHPEFKIALSSNYKPVIGDSDPAIWSRIRLIPFKVSIPEERRDTKLGKKLMAETPGILRWAVEGCLKWQTDGLPVPLAVKEATGAYQNESDLVRRFLADSCELNPIRRISLAELYTAFVKSGEENEALGIGKKQLGERLTKLGYHKSKSGDIRYWCGIGIKAEDDLPTAGRVGQ